MSSTALAASSPTLTQTSTGKSAAPAHIAAPHHTPAKKATPVSSPAQPSKNTTTPQGTGSASRTVGADGRWLHPRLNEIIQRRNANAFDKSNFQAVMINVGLLLSSFFVSSILRSLLPSIWIASIDPITKWLLLALRTLFLANTTIALLPLFRKPDPCEDIPLTPSQRRLLGLPPMSRPATPQEQEQFVTPPRFSRSATPRSATSSLRAEASESPLASFGTPLDGSTFGTRPDSPFSASAHRSPSERSRFMYNNPDRSSPLSGGSGMANIDPFMSSTSSLVASSNTPTKNGRASVSLNNKWLYEKGRASPRGSPGASSARNGYFS